MEAQKAARGDKAHDPRYEELMGRLKDARISLGLTQVALAARLQRHQQFVSRYEGRQRRLDAVELYDVATELGLDPAALLNELDRTPNIKADERHAHRVVEGDSS
jgi:transcriptional regulator with XRE-family HTH domain